MVIIYVDHGHVVQVEQLQGEQFVTLAPDKEIDGYHVVYLEQIQKEGEGEA